MKLLGSCVRSKSCLRVVAGGRIKRAWEDVSASQAVFELSQADAFEEIEMMHPFQRLSLSYLGRTHEKN